MSGETTKDEPNYYRILKHKYFQCDNCANDYNIRDDSDLNICFFCSFFLCDGCIEEHKRREIYIHSDE